MMYILLFTIVFIVLGAMIKSYKEKKDKELLTFTYYYIYNLYPDIVKTEIGPDLNKNQAILTALNIFLRWEQKQLGVPTTIEVRPKKLCNLILQYSLILTK